MAKGHSREDLRLIRKKRIRRVVVGTPERPRVSVFRSNKHIYAALVDDLNHKTLAGVSSLSKEVRSQNPKGMDTAKAVGSALAGKAKTLKIEQVVFDRGGYRYHGKVKALADAAREAGLQF